MERNAWNQFVSSTPECPILQSFEWAEVKGWEPIRVVVEGRGKIVAAASILKRKIPYINKSIFYCPNGPVIDFDNQALFLQLIEKIKGEAKKNKAIMLKIDPPILEEKASILKKQGFIANKKQVQPRTTFYLDLSKSEDDILKNCEEKTRYNIRLSSKKGVVVGEGSVQEFYDIYKETSKRDSFLIHPLSYYQKIKKYLVDRGMAKIFIAYLKDEPIAGVFVFMFGQRVWYMYGASKSAHRNVMPNHALHWHIIKWAKQAGYKIYDLWGIPSNPNPKHPLWGVYRFKKGFRGKLVKYVGMHDLVFDPLFYHLFEKGLSFYKNVRSLLTKGKISDSLEE
ncbi:MAG: peptidoglycan bridge formation glycyltransferase FemA/FemB family protein [Candidatus Saganbacteria bacterium]|nr:peptidoglycan bridge formation glycyltransferase FemA/FemB family protein [Candidatus Saganbacteria bacterium]